MRRALVWLAFLAAATCATAASAQQVRFAVFPFALNDTSLEGEKRGIDPAETARLAMITREVSDKLAARGAALADLRPHAQAIAELPDSWNCNGCEAPVARQAGADIALTGFVHKVSTLIQSIAMVARDAETGQVIGQAAVSIRGNTDEAWLRGVDYILKRGLLGERVEAALAR